MMKTNEEQKAAESAAAVSVAGIMIDGERFFIAQRKSGGALSDLWEFPGGKVEYGESCEDALVREYQEEFGIPVRAGAFLGESFFEHRGVVRALRAYCIEPLSRDICLHEHVAFRWATLGEIEALPFAPSDLGLLDFLRGITGIKH